MVDAFGSAQGAVDSLLGTLATVIRDEARLLGNIRGDVQFIKDEMESMNGFLLHVSEGCDDDDHQVRAWKKQVRDVAMESEQWVQRYQRWAGTAPRNLVRRIPHWLLTMHERHDIATKIQELKARAQEVGERRQRYGVEVPPRKGRPVLDPQGGNRGDDDETEEQYSRRCCLLEPKQPDITREEEQELIKWLTEQDDAIPALRLIRVVGLGERGKARFWSKVFANGFVDSHFARRSWINVDPEVSSPDPILENIVLDLERQDEVKHEGGLISKVGRHLEGKRYLIVFNGIQNEMTWAVLSIVFKFWGAPGSAMVILTDEPSFMQSSYYRSLDKLANTVMFYMDRAIDLTVKTERAAEKVELFKQIMIKLAQNFYYSKLLLHLLYVKPNMSFEDLKCLCDSLSPGCGIGPGQVLLFSYNDLPSDYRNCMLYLSIYPQRWRIRRTSLVRRWVIEGLITRRAGLSALDAAERCFTVLLDRGLLLRVEMDSTGKAKRVVVPDNVIWFIVMTARAENFADLNLTPDLAPFLSIGNGIQQRQQQVHTGSRNFFSGILQSILCNCNSAAVAVPEAIDSNMPPHPVFALLENLPTLERNGLLKVLDLEGGIGFRKQHLSNICQVSELRFLNLRGTDVTQLPDDIHKLQSLETLDIRGTKVKALPAKVVLLRKIKHLRSGYIEYERKEGADALGLNESFSAVQMAPGIGNMMEMQILSHVEVPRGSGLDVLVSSFERLQKLRKLGVVVHGRMVPHVRDVLRAIEKLDRCLVSLSIHFKEDLVEGEDDNSSNDTAGIGLITLPRLLRCIKLSGFPSGLTEYVRSLSGLVSVALQHTSLKKSDLRSLGLLANLRCLKLGFISLVDASSRSSEEMGETFALQKDEFQSLKLLFLQHTAMTQLSFEQGASPQLESIAWYYSRVNSLSGIHHLKRLKKLDFYGSQVSDGVKNDDVYMDIFSE